MPYALNLLVPCGYFKIITLLCVLGFGEIDNFMFFRVSYSYLFGMFEKGHS